MIWLLALAACAGNSGEKADKGETIGTEEVVAREPERRPVALPPGEAITTECFASQLEREKSYRRNQGSPTPMPTTAAPPPGLSAPTPKAATKAPFRPRAEPAEAEAAPAADGASTATSTPPSSGGRAARPDPSVSTEIIASSDSSVVHYDESGSVISKNGPAGSSGTGGLLGSRRGGGDVAGAEQTLQPTEAKPDATVGYKGTDKKRDQGNAGPRRANDEAPRQKPKVEEAKVHLPPQPRVDWGGTTWLSNDDSMSLASAQRLLYDVKEHVDFQPSEVRPHELLNYFTFDSQKPESPDLFSVTSSAEQTGSDQLTLALSVQGAMPERRPLDLTLVVDVSGSMTAEGRMDYVKRGLNKMSEQLERGDRVNLVIFDNQVCTPLEDYVQGRDAPSVLSEAIDQLRPRGSTDLDAGLHEGYRLAGKFASQDSAHDRNHRVMVLTDALLNTGDVNPDTVSEIAKNYENNGVRLTGVGVGREFNDAVLDKLTEKGKGAYVYLGSEAVVDRIMGVGFRSLTETIAHDVRFELDLPDSLGLSRFYGEEASSDPEDIQPINYYAGTRQLFLQDLRVRDGRIVGADPIALTIHYQDATTGEAREQRYTVSVGQALATDHHNVDKARALMAWTDFLQARAMHGEPCSAPLTEYRSRAGKVTDDAEIAYVNSLTGPLCGVDLGSPVDSGVAWRVRVDSDTPIAEVTLSCPSGEQRQTLSASDTVARFNATPGSCTLTLQGPVPLMAKVNVPATGGEARCTVRGGRMSCG